MFKAVFTRKNTEWFLKALCCGLALSFILSMTGFCASCKDIENRILRFHIIANSDTKEDQELKLKVRDTVTVYTDKLFKNCKSKQEALKTAQEKIEDIRNTAQEKVYSEGYDYPVRAEVTNMDFDTRVYDDFTLPAGKYDAVRITIGSGKGHNWWCVLYPAVCIGSASEKIGSALTENENDIVTGSDKYIVRFRIVEWFGQLIMREKQ